MGGAVGAFGPLTNGGDAVARTCGHRHKQPAAHGTPDAVASTACQDGGWT